METVNLIQVWIDMRAGRGFVNVGKGRAGHLWNGAETLCLRGGDGDVKHLDELLASYCTPCKVCYGDAERIAAEYLAEQADEVAGSAGHGTAETDSVAPVGTAEQGEGGAMTYTVRYTRGTNHIEGVAERTVSGKDSADSVGYYAQSACATLTRSGATMGVSKSFESLADALAHARIVGQRAVCKRCEAAAEAAIAAEAATAETAADPAPFYCRTFSATARHIINPEARTRTLCGHAVSLPDIYKDDSGNWVRPDAWMILDLPPCKGCERSANSRGIQPTHGELADAPSASMSEDNNEGNEMSAPKGLHTVKVGFEGKTYHLWDGESDTLLCGRKADGPNVFDHLDPTCKTCVKRAPETEETPEMPAAKNNAAADKPDVEQLQSDFYDTLDRLKAVVAEGTPSKANMVEELAAEAELIVGKLPANQRVEKRAEIKSAKTPAAAPETAAVAVKDIEDLSTIDGVKELQDEATAKVRESLKLGKEASSKAEEVARIVINMRSLAPNPATGLPDLMAERKPTKDGSGKIFAAIKEEIGVEDKETEAVFNSVQRSIQNKFSDVLVEWIRAMDQPESWETFAELFPAAAEMVAESTEEATKAHNDAVAAAEESGEDFDSDSLPAPLSPSEALYKLYESKNVKLTRRGRTEVELERKRVAAVTKARVALVAATDAVEALGESADEETRTAAEKAAEEAAAKVKAAEAKLPEKVLKEIPAAKVRSKGDKLKERVSKSRDVISAVTEEGTFKKLEADEKAALLADLEALNGFIAARMAALKAAK
ncbi:hypothetical protein ACFQ8S_06835 [Streptomyces virginiae]|uniref:hypothetical protein n=1 Tax=Streptomyces virginiae TaxID=1961 RepID=UPI0036A4909F